MTLGSFYFVYLGEGIARTNINSDAAIGNTNTNTLQSNAFIQTYNTISANAFIQNSGGRVLVGSYIGDGIDNRWIGLPTPGVTSGVVLLSAQGSSLIFDDNFNRADSGTVGNGWFETEPTGSFYLTGSQLALNDANSSGSHECSHLVKGFNTGTCVFRVKWIQPSAAGQTQISLGSPVPSAARIKFGMFTNWTHWPGGTATTIKTATAGSIDWLIVADFTGSKYSLWFDGSFIGSNFAFVTNGSVDGISINNTGNNNNIVYKWDNMEYWRLPDVGSSGGVLGMNTPFSRVSMGSLSAYYKLDGVGSDSHSTNHGTPSGITWASTGVIGSAAIFDGVAGSIRITNPDMSTYTKNFSVAGWMKWNTPATPSKRFCGTRVVTPSAGWAFGTVGGSLLRLTTNTIKDYDDTTVISIDTWTHVAAVMIDNDVQFFVNGSLKTTVTHTADGISNAGSDFLLGCRGSPTTGSAFELFTGSLDEFGFWKRTLSPFEIAELYNRGSGLAHKFLGSVAAWPVGIPGSATNNLIRNINSGSFQISSDNDVNNSSGSYYYVVFEGTGRHLQIGSYFGDKTDNRLIPIDNLVTSPAWVIIGREKEGALISKIKSMGSENNFSNFFGINSPNIGSAITTLSTSGFTVKNHPLVNTNGSYFYAVFQGGSGLGWGSYIGNQAATRDISTSTGSPQRFILVKPSLEVGVGSILRPQNLISYYPFDNNFLDYAGSNHGSGSQVRFFSDAFGSCAGNVAGYIDIGSLTELNSVGSFSIVMWFRPDANQATNVGLFTRGTTAQRTPWITFNGSKIHCEFETASGVADGSIAIGSYFLGSWFHYAAIYDGSNLFAYLNGSKIGTDTVTGTSMSNTDGTTYIGSHPAGNKYVGSVAHLSVWNTNLSTNEINYLYNVGGSHISMHFAPEINLMGSLMHYWNFEILGSPLDMIGAHGLFADTTAVQRVGGIIGSCYRFDGASTARMTGSASPTFVRNDFTFQVWFKSNTNAATNFLSKADRSTGNGFTFEQTATGSLQMKLNNTARALSVNTNNPNDGSWHHAIGLRNGSMLQIYLDATLVGSETIAPADLSTTPTTAFALGSSWTAGVSYYTGSMDEIGIWTRALSIPEIQCLYNNGSGLRIPFTQNFMSWDTPIMITGSQVLGSVSMLTRHKHIVSPSSQPYSNAGLYANRINTISGSGFEVGSDLND